MKKTISLLFTVLFLALCLLPGVGMLLAGEAPAAANEVLADAPRLSTGDGRFNSDFLSDLTSYMGDRFFLRQEAITAWNAVNARVLGSSAAESILLGRDGWLFFAETLPDYTQSAPLSERELWSAARVVALMQEYAQDQGSRFLFTLCPNKNSLYPDYMPKSVHAGSGVSDATRFQAVLTGMGVNYLDLFAALEAHDEPLYFAADSHWNAKGAAVGADAILGALELPGGWVEGGFVAGEPHKGDLYEMLYPAGKATEADFAPAEGYSFTYVRNIRGPTDITIQTQDGEGGGSLLCFRDSFGNNLYPYLAQRFERSVFSRLNAYDLSLIQKHEADTVVIELVERNIRYLLRYTPVFPAPVREADTAAAISGGAIAASAKKSPLEGHTLLTGALPAAAAADAPLYLSDGDTLWEATPSAEGFAAHLPGAAEELSSLTLVYTTGDGQRLACPLSVAE